MGKCSDILKVIGLCLFTASARALAYFNIRFLLLLLFAFAVVNAKAQQKYVDEKSEPPITFDEVSVLVKVKGVKEFYVDAIYSSNDLLYVSVEELFNALGIPCTWGQDGESISGFIGDERKPYLISYTKQQVSVGGKIYNFRSGLIKEKGTLYMESPLFTGTFEMTMNFNFRILTLMVNPNFEVPIIKQQRIEALRNNVSKIKGEEVADTVLKRNYHLLKMGMVDWSVASYQKWKGATDNRFGLAIGTELLYGEADVSVNYYNRQKFDDRQLFYLWRWVDNDRTAIRQAQVGRISNQTIAFINSPIIGAVIRNTPTTIRKAKGDYTINEIAEPNWTVELYINNVLVDYTKTDASGSYTFKVPMVYGYTTLKLRFYGPLGEERTEERTMNIPYTVMPTGEFEYGLSAGMLEDSLSSRFGRAEFNYGLNRFVTVGGGLEYLSSITNGAYIPFAKATIQPFSKMILSGEYDHGVKTRGLLDYYFWKDALLELDFTKYVEGQKATLINALEERKVKLSLPFKMKTIPVYSRLEFVQQVYKSVNFNQANMMLSLYYRQFSANSSTQLNWINKEAAYVTSNLSLSYRLRDGFLIRPSAYGNLSDCKLISCRVDLEKSIPKGYLSASYERNFSINDNFISLNFKYDLSFARTNLSVSRSGGSYYTSQSAQGSLAFGGGNKYIYASNNLSVSKGGISLYPFLDLNNNGIFDEGEHMIKLTSLRVPGGNVVYSEKDSIVRVANLNAFVSYMVEFNDNDLENISWRFKYKKYQVLIDPNQFKRIDVPVVVVGESNGMVYLNDQESLKGIGRIVVKIYKKGTTKAVAEMLSESDGYISYIGLTQGNYVAFVDSTQLQRLDYTATPQQIPFTIKAVEDGDVVSGVDFILNRKKDSKGYDADSTSLKTSTTTRNTSAIGDVSKGADSDMIEQNITDGIKRTAISNEKEEVDSVMSKIVNPLAKSSSCKQVWDNTCKQVGNYYVQCGAFKVKSNAMRRALTLNEKKDLDVGIILHHGFYKVRVGCVPTKQEAVSIRNKVPAKKRSDGTLIMKRK